jgi:hypothetical protein
MLFPLQAKPSGPLTVTQVDTTPRGLLLVALGLIEDIVWVGRVDPGAAVTSADVIIALIARASTHESKMVRSYVQMPISPVFVRPLKLPTRNGSKRANFVVRT